MNTIVTPDDTKIRHLTEKEVAERLNITTRTVRKWREDGHGIPCMGLGADGQTYRYRLSDIEAYEEGKLIGEKVPAAARNTMLRAAQAMEVILRWPMRDEQRALLEGVCSDLRVHAIKPKE